MRNFFYILSILYFTGCAYKEFNPCNPEEYEKYWKEHKEESILYDGSDDVRKKKKMQEKGIFIKDVKE